MSKLDGFPEVPQAVLDNASKNALAALDAPETPCLLAEFYDQRTNFAGATFALLDPRDPHQVTATDLLAVTTLSVDIPPLAVRRFLEDEATQAALSNLLRALPQRKLQDTTEADFTAMASVYDLVKESLARAGTKTSNPWVTASKLVARKRPDLFPVRDSVVCSYLGIDKLRYYAKDWYVYRQLMKSPDVADKLEELPSRIHEASGSRELTLDAEPLRLLDAALWRFGSTNKRA